MATWLLLLILGANLTCLCLLWWTFKENHRQRGHDATQLANLIQLHRADFDSRLLALEKSLLTPFTAAIKRIDQQRQQEKEVSQNIGSFLPDDQTEAAYERELKQSEKHFIAANGPMQYSSQPSRGSASRSGREPLIRRRSPSSSG